MTDEIDGQDNVQVFVRVRPLSDTEIITYPNHAILTLYFIGAGCLSNSQFMINYYRPQKGYIHSQMSSIFVALSKPFQPSRPR